MTDALPKGPCPEEEKLFNVVAKIINQEGAQNLTFKALRIRIESELKISMEEHRGAINKAAEKAVRAPRTLKRLQDFDEERRNGTLVSVGQGKARTKKSKSSKSKSSSGGTRVKKEKNSGPKGPQSAFFLWMNEQRPKWVAEGVAFTEVGKKAGALWAEMSDEDKAPWEAKKAEDVKRYEKECEEFEANGGVIKKKIKKEKKEEKDKGPKRPQSAFFLWMNEQRPKWVADGVAFTEVGKKAGAMWAEMSDDDKAPWEAKKAEDVKRYEAECRELGIDPKAKSAPKKKKVQRTKRNRSSKSRGGDSSSVSSFSSSSDGSSSDSSSDSDSSSSLSSDSSSISSDSSDTAE